MAFSQGARVAKAVPGAERGKCSLDQHCLTRYASLRTPAGQHSNFTTLGPLSAALTCTIASADAGNDAPSPKQLRCVS